MTLLTELQTRKSLHPASRRMLLGCIFLFLTTLVMAQNVTVRGKVTSSGNGEPIPGANVIVKGTTTGTITSINGDFTLTVPSPTATLVVTFIGYTPLEIPLQGRSTLNVALESSVTELDEVVAIGYGTVQRKDVTGSVASVSGESLAAIPVATANEAITGKLAGVQVAATEGSPDAEIIIRVRGGGSITGDNTPLFILDGFPVNSISDISPSDIESIDVLKDASSTAIYGARGANGVIIVTTKKGKEGKLRVNYNAYSLENWPTD